MRERNPALGVGPNTDIVRATMGDCRSHGTHRGRKVIVAVIFGADDSDDSAHPRTPLSQILTPRVARLPFVDQLAVEALVFRGYGIDAVMRNDAGTRIFSQPASGIVW